MKWKADYDIAADEYNKAGTVLYFDISSESHCFGNLSNYMQPCATRALNHIKNARTVS